MAYTQTILSSEEMAELQELVDEAKRRIVGMWNISEYADDDVTREYDCDTIKRIAEILGLEINQD